MVASACLTLAAIHLLVWCSKRLGGARLAFAIVAALCWLFPSQSQAAQPTFRSDAEYLIDTWETEDGLPENSATAMVQTPDGYLWFGTFKGLVRFDGVKFKVFNTANTPRLPSAMVVNLHRDHVGRLWVSTDRGLVVLDGQRWRGFGTNEGWVGNYVRMFAERANGDMLMTTFDGHVLEFVNGRLSGLPAPPGAAGQGYFAHVDEAGQWWVVQNQFIGRWDGSRWAATLSSPDVPVPVGVALGCAPARDGGLWLLLNVELRKYSHGKEVSRHVLPNDAEGTLGSVSSMFEDSLGNVWIASFDAGLTQVLPNGGVRRWYKRNGISYEDVRFVFEDREENLWVGTSGGGLMRFKPRRFRSFSGTSLAPMRTVTSVSPISGGGLWIATFGGGLLHLSEEGNLTVRPYDGPRPNAFFQCVLTDRKGSTWLGLLDEGLSVFDQNARRLIPEEQTAGKDVKALFEDSVGRLWISGGRGISVFSAGVFRVFGPEQGFPIGAVSGFAEDRDGRIWASSLNGVFRLEKERFVEVQDGRQIPLRGIACLKGDADGTMWMGSLSAGLLRWREGSLATIGAEAGFPVESVYGILEDDQGHLWMASNRGVARVQRKELQSVADGVTSRLSAQLFDMNDGLPSVECSSQRQPVCARDARGRLWFATAKGAAMIDPASFHLNALPPPVRIERVGYLSSRGSSRTGNSQPSGESGFAQVRLVEPFAKPLRLPPGSYGLEIEYTALSFSSPEKVRFQTRLEGTGHEWEEAQGPRIARFHQLEPGDYLFRVRAANNDGVWNETGASLAFTVLPFYWQTLWFKLLGLVALSAVVYGAIRRRFTQVEKAQAAQHAFARQLILSQENERKRVAAELHDGLGQNLLLIKNRLAMASTRQADAAELTRQLDAATAATARAIGEVRTIAHALRPAALEQVGLTKAIEWMVEQLGEGAATKFSAELDNIDGLLAPEMEVNLFRIIQEGLNNIIRHASAAQVILEVKREEGGIRLSVFDDGRGFEAAKRRAETASGQGLGLASMEERAQFLGGNLDLQSAPGRGTRLTVRVPLPQTKP